MSRQILWLFLGVKTKCCPCPIGTYQPRSGQGGDPSTDQGACLECNGGPHNRASSSGIPASINPKAGYYCDGEGSGTRKTCKNNEYAMCLFVDSVLKCMSCTTCKGGKILGPRSVNPSAAYGSPCYSPCAVGQYAQYVDKYSTGRCVACPAGKVSSSPKSDYSTCSTCPAGKASNSEASAW
jgi:hypothetical protein